MNKAQVAHQQALGLTKDAKAVLRNISMALDTDTAPSPYAGERIVEWSGRLASYALQIQAQGHAIAAAGVK